MQNSWWVRSIEWKKRIVALKIPLQATKWPYVRWIIYLKKYYCVIESLKTTSMEKPTLKYPPSASAAGATQKSATSASQSMGLFLFWRGYFIRIINQRMGWVDNYTAGIPQLPLYAARAFVPKGLQPPPTVSGAILAFKYSFSNLASPVLTEH